MTPEFLTAVKRMRKWQKAYFANRFPESLRKAKDAEREVDRLITEYEQQQADGLQPKLM